MRDKGPGRVSECWEGGRWERKKEGEGGSETSLYNKGEQGSVGKKEGANREKEGEEGVRLHYISRYIFCIQIPIPPGREDREHKERGKKTEVEVTRPPQPLEGTANMDTQHIWCYINYLYTTVDNFGRQPTVLNQQPAKPPP